jgi:hypothetical protein
MIYQCGVPRHSCRGSRLRAASARFLSCRMRGRPPTCLNRRGALVRVPRVPASEPVGRVAGSSSARAQAQAGAVACPRLRGHAHASCDPGPTNPPPSIPRERKSLHLNTAGTPNRSSSAQSTSALADLGGAWLGFHLGDTGACRSVRAARPWPSGLSHGLPLDLRRGSSPPSPTGVP